MKHLSRILCALAVFITSSAYAIAMYRAALHHRITIVFVISVLIFASIGVLSFLAIYFILGKAKA